MRLLTRAVSLLAVLSIGVMAEAAPLCTPPTPAGVPCTAHRAVPNGSTSWSSGEYKYDPAGNIYEIGTNYYVYDGASRLREGTPAYGSGEQLTGYHQSFEYDEYGNFKSAVTVTDTSTTETNLAIDGLTNQLAAADYDAAGNMTSIDGTTHYTWDALNAMVSGPDEEYVYDADDERIATIRTSGTQSVTTYSVRGVDQKVLREVTDTVTSGNHAWSWQRDYVYRDDQLLAQFLPGEIRRHFHLDHLGSPRIVTNDAGNRTSTMVYSPYGDEAPGTNLGDGNDPLRYTGHEKVEGGAYDLYYMHARYQLARKGRFLSVDPTWDSADIVRPQSWNRYSYVLNNPVLHTDPDGRCSLALVDCVIEGFVVAGSSGALEVFATGLAIFTGTAYMRGGGSGMCCESPAMDRQAQTMANHFSEKYAPKDKDGNPQPLPTDKHNNATPDPAAEGRPHTQLGTRTKPKNGEAPYPQSRTWDGKEHGQRGVRIDNTNHNRPKDHPNPHQHRIDPDGKEHPAEPVPEIPPGS